MYLIEVSIYLFSTPHLYWYSWVGPAGPPILVLEVGGTSTLQADKFSHSFSRKYLAFLSSIQNESGISFNVWKMEAKILKSLVLN